MLQGKLTLGLHSQRDVGEQDPPPQATGEMQPQTSQNGRGHSQPAQWCARVPDMLCNILDSALYTAVTRICATASIPKCIPLLHVQ